MDKLFAQCGFDSLKLFSSFNGVYSIDSSSNVAYHRFSNVSRSGDKNVTCFYPFGQHILVGTSNGMFCYTDGTDVLEHLDGYPKLDNVGKISPLFNFKFKYSLGPRDVSFCRQKRNQMGGLFVGTSDF